MISKVCFVALAFAVACSAIRMEKLKRNMQDVVRGTAAAPNQNMPEGYTECGASFAVVSNCGGGSFSNCQGEIGIFSESWIIDGPPGSTASTYLICEWTGPEQSGECIPKSSGVVSEDYCFIPIPLSPSPVPSPSISPTRFPTIAGGDGGNNNGGNNNGGNNNGGNNNGGNNNGGSDGDSSPTSSPSISPTRFPTIAGSDDDDYNSNPSPAASSSPMSLVDRCHALATTHHNFQPVKVLEGSLPNYQLVVGDSFSLSLSDIFCDPEDDPMTYTMSGNTPDGLSISNNALSGNINQPGHFTVTIYACDGNHHPCTPTNTFMIDVDTAL